MDDIKASFMFGYPNELTFKLYDRRGRCHLKLRHFAEAAQAFEEALLKIEESKLEAGSKKKETFISEAKKNLEEIKPKINEGKVSFSFPFPFQFHLKTWNSFRSSYSGCLCHSFMTDILCIMQSFVRLLDTKYKVNNITKALLSSNAVCISLLSI